MKTYSLINVFYAKGNKVSGNWIRDYTGSLEDAIILAKATMVANSNRIVVAVVDKVGCTSQYGYFTNLKRLF